MDFAILVSRTRTDPLYHHHAQNQIPKNMHELNFVHFLIGKFEISKTTKNLKIGISKIMKQKIIYPERFIPYILQNQQPHQIDCGN